MKINEFFASAQKPEIDLSRYLKKNVNPPLNTQKITVSISDAKRIINTPVAGAVALVLGYKNRPGALISLNEEDNGLEWQIPQVQGIKSRKSYRIDAGMDWQTVLGKFVGKYASFPEATVEHITMPHINAIEGIEGAKSENVGKNYHLVIKALSMKFSQELNRFIVDVKKQLK